MAVGMLWTGVNPRVLGIQRVGINLRVGIVHSHQQDSTKTQQTSVNSRAASVQRTSVNSRAKTVRSHPWDPMEI